MSFDFSRLRQLKEESRQEVFRFECLQTYNVEGDIEEFERWKRGEPTAADDPANEYYQGLRRLRAGGVQARRVRLADFPVHDYLRYEIDFYRGSQRHGEEVLLLERALGMDCMQHTVVTGDYWLFDGRIVLVFDYDADGSLKGQNEVADPASVARYRRLRDCLVNQALPLEQFLARYPESFSAPSPMP